MHLFDRVCVCAVAVDYRQIQYISSFNNMQCDYGAENKNGQTKIKIKMECRANGRRTTTGTNSKKPFDW